MKTVGELAPPASAEDQDSEAGYQYYLWSLEFPEMETEITTMCMKE